MCVGMDAMNVKLCQLCSFKAPSLTYLLKHIRQVHAHRPGFQITCGISGCPRIFRTFEVFRNHVYGFHTDVETVQRLHTTGDDDESPDSPMDEQIPQESSSVSRKEAAATWILKVQELCKLPQSTMEVLLGDVTGFIQDLLTDLYEDIKQALAAAGINSSSIQGFPEMFDKSSKYACPFAGLETQHLQLKFYKKAFNFIVRELLL